MSDERKKRYIREEIQQKNANYVRDKNKPSQFIIRDDSVIKLGETWYKMGHSLEDAEIELRRDANFVRGYNHAVTQDIVNEHLYSLGIEYFQKGIPIDEVPANYADKSYFVRGYNDALKSSLSEKKKSSRR